MCNPIGKVRQGPMVAKPAVDAVAIKFNKTLKTIHEKDLSHRRGNIYNDSTGIFAGFHKRYRFVYAKKIVVG
jgi:hypothetical protein